MIVYVLFYLIDYSKYIVLIGSCQLQKYTPYSACNAFILWRIWYYIFSMENSIVRYFAMKGKFIFNSGQLSIKQPTTSRRESLKTERTMTCGVGQLCVFHWGCFDYPNCDSLFCSFNSYFTFRSLSLGFWVEKNCNNMNETN